MAFMGKTIINICIDADVKRQFQALCAEAGLSMTAGFSLLARKCVEEKRIPFDDGARVPAAQSMAAPEEAGQMRDNPLSVKNK